MLDLLIKGGLVVDGTGQPAFRADVGVHNGRIVHVGESVDATEVLDARGRIVAPGFVDIHTHYDAQVMWDPWLTPSCYQGVTTVIAGNCGFTLAPCRPEQRETMVGTLESVEDMSGDTLRAGIPWQFESFAEYLDTVDRHGLGVNFAAYVGHTALRLWAMGDEAHERAATDDELGAMRDALQTALRAGAIGFSTDRSRFHRGDGGRPVPTAVAPRGEIESLLRVVGAEGRVAQVNPDDEFDWLYEVQPSVGCRITWTALVSYPARVAGRTFWRDKLGAHRAGFASGAQVRPQVTCRPLSVQFSLVNPTPFISAPVFAELMSTPPRERERLYADESFVAAARTQLAEKRHANVPWESIVVSEGADPSLLGKTLGVLARRDGRTPFDVMVEIARANHLETRFLTIVGNDNEQAVRELLLEDGCILGISDAGAHVSMLCDANMPVDFLANWVRDRAVMPLEQGIRKLTSEPADFFGLTDRGIVRPGAHADVVVFDIDRLDPGPLRRVRDLPADGERLVADQVQGIDHVVVNGTVACRSGEWQTNLRPGKVLR
ncbi:MAG TPA: amidohydrolase family protein [Acidimicrobiales bacterium]|nr:amidohydrolase family protein [Acidimicrobiales bacterium]